MENNTELEIGQTLSKGRIVTAIQAIVRHGPRFPNRRIKTLFYAVGPKGGLWSGYVFNDGQMKMERIPAHCQGFAGYTKYDGLTGKFV